MAISVNLFAESDNELKLEGLRNTRTSAYINDATVVAHVCGDTILNPTAGGVATSEEVGAKTGIPCVGNSLNEGDKILILGSNYCEGIQEVQAGSDENKIIVDVAYAEHTFIGDEEIYKVIENGVNLALTYDTGSDGDYYGILPETAMLVVGNAYYLFIIATSGTTVLTTRVKYNAVYA